MDRFFFPFILCSCYRLYLSERPSPSLYVNYFRRSLLPSPCSKNSLSWTLSLHTIMFCSATFPIPPGEVIDIIRVTSNTLVPCWQWKIKSLTEYECECPNPATHAIRDSISFGWPDNHKIPYAPFRTSVNDLLVTMIRLEL